MNFQPQFGHEDTSQASEASLELDDRLSEAQQQKQWVGELVCSKGWHMVVAFVEEQCKRRLNEVMLTPATSTSEAELNFTRGEYAGMQLVVKHIEALLENANELVEHFKEQS